MSGRAQKVLGEALDLTDSERAVPYSVAFIELASAIRVVAIAHERRRPGYWAERMK
jgi:hypothetical protein